MNAGVEAVAEFMGVSPERVPDKLVTHRDGIPWSMHEALRIAYEAGLLQFVSYGYAARSEGQPGYDSSTDELIAFVRDTLQNGANPTRGNVAFGFLAARIPTSHSIPGSDAGPVPSPEPPVIGPPDR